MKFTSSGGSKFENPAPGSYAAVCTRIIDLGTQKSVWNGEEKYSPKMMMVFELSELMSDGRPFIATRSFTTSLHERSSLRKFLEGWRGNAFSDSDLSGFTGDSLIGKGCLLSLVQNGDYVNIDHASKLPKGMNAPKPVGETIYLDLSNFDRSAFDKLSDRIKEKISQSPEYKAMTKGESGKGESENPGSGMDDMTDDIPFN